MDIFSCAWEKSFDPKAAGVYDFHFDWLYVGAIYDNESITSASEACASREDKLLSGTGWF